MPLEFGWSTLALTNDAMPGWRPARKFQDNLALLLFVMELVLWSLRRRLVQGVHPVHGIPYVAFVLFFPPLIGEFSFLGFQFGFQVPQPDANETVSSDTFDFKAGAF